MSDWKPIKDRIVVERTADVEGNIGGIIIPDNAKEKKSEGIVLMVGQGKYDNNGVLLPMEVEIGDRIVFGKYGGVEIKIDGKEYLTMREEEVLLRKPKEQ